MFVRHKHIMATMMLLVVTATVSAQELSGGDGQQESAQSHTWAVGVRVGGANGGLTVRRALDTHAVELGVALAADNSGRLQALYEWQRPVIAEGFTFYYGAGGFVGAYDYSTGTQMGLGVEGVIGLEYQFPELPIAVSLDYRPSMSLLPDFSKSAYADIGLGLKFCF